MIAEIKCNHYQRNCDKQAPCCKLFYPCRLCHDANFKGPKTEGCKQENMDRFAVTIIRCRECQTEQPVSNQCTNCQIQFALYYCPICKLWENNPRKQIYHCDKCKMCRLGSTELNSHCEICDICWLKGPHKCTEKAFEQNCMVCQEYLKSSTQYIQQLEFCGHLIHTICLEQLLKNHQNNCPICNTAIYKMQKEEIEEYDKIVNEFELPEELKDKKVSIICMECHQKSIDIPFHFYLKCGNCGSYNTKE